MRSWRDIKLAEKISLVEEFLSIRDLDGRFCNFADVRKKLQERFVDVPRDAVPYVVTSAFRKGLLVAIPDSDDVRAAEICKRHRSLKSCSILRNRTMGPVARCAARRLLSLILDKAKEKREREPDRAVVVTCIWAGGRTPDAIAHYLAAMLSSVTDMRNSNDDAALLPERSADLPDEIVVYSMIGSLDRNISRGQPGANSELNDPNAFLERFSESRVGVSIRKLGVPGITSRDDFEAFRRSEAFFYAQHEARECDVLVTSAGHWEQGHRSLFDYVVAGCHGRMKPRWESEHTRLMNQGVIGDFAWIPVGTRRGPHGPETVKPELFAWGDVGILSLFDGSELQNRVKNGMRVVFACSPCGGCTGSKSALVKTVLNLEPHVVTDLIVDADSASQL